MASWIEVTDATEGQKDVTRVIKLEASTDKDSPSAPCAAIWVDMLLAKQSY